MIMIPTVIKVLLNDDSSSVVEVPITPNTTAQDVIDCCKEPGETDCHLKEVWRNKERLVNINEKPFTILQQWGSHAPEVNFSLQHYHVPEAGNSINQPPADINSMLSGYGILPKDFFNDKANLPLHTYKEIAQQQQRQIEMQQQTLVGKEQRLRLIFYPNVVFVITYSLCK